MNKKGSFTIEAAILMPFLLFVILIIMQVSFFLYNREAATAMVAQAVLKGVQMEKEGKNEIYTYCRHAFRFNIFRTRC